MPSRGGVSPSTMFLPVIAAAVFMVVLTDNVVNIILPLLARTFDASIAQVGWTITGYALVLAVGVPLYGRVSDFWGVRRVFSLAFPLFAAGSLVAALAPGLGVLVLGRIVQGAGAAGIPALATVAVAKLLPPGRRGAAFGVIASSVGAGAAAGPVLGGVVGQVLGWRALFLALLALSLLLHVLARRVLPAENGAGRRDFDLPGGVLVGAAAGLTLFGVTSLQIHGASSVATWGSFLVAAHRRCFATGRTWPPSRRPSSPGRPTSRCWCSYRFSWCGWAACRRVRPGWCSRPVRWRWRCSRRVPGGSRTAWDPGP
ncbi:MAG: MFS transporter [Deinococcales bacterium]